VLRAAAVFHGSRLLLRLLENVKILVALLHARRTKKKRIPVFF
jgi:hypothetical protein